MPVVAQTALPYRAPDNATEYILEAEIFAVARTGFCIDS
jgi:hypothetical protein